jgi:D-glycero-D-manno-heptose 1,7-bisphosphate phosphatase
MTFDDGKSRAVFLDRDGTIMHDTPYCSDPKQVHVFENVPAALRQLKAKGYKLIIITNQSGIGRGFFTVEQYHAVAAELLRQLGDGVIDATYFCPDRPEQQSQFRKPAPGMILQAAREHHVDLTRSFFVGDKEIDAECGHNASVRTIRVRTGSDKMTGSSRADWTADDLAEAARIIVNATKE